MAQGKFCHRIDIFLLDSGRTTPRRMGTGATQPDQVGTQAVDPCGKAALGDVGQRLVIQGDTV